MKFAKDKLIKTTIFISLMLCVLLSIFWQAKLGELFKFRPNIDYDAPSVHFLYASKGDCILIRTSSGENIIIDSADPSAKSDVMTYIDNVFFYNKPKVFDYAILTHTDDDHVGNFYDIVNKYNIKHFYRPNIYVANMELADNDTYCNSYTYRLLITSLNSKNIDTHFHTELPYISFTHGYMQWCTPTVNKYYNNKKNNYSSINDYSPIIIYKDMNTSFFFSGDASVNVEEEFISNNIELDGCIDVLKMGHHGSATGTSSELLEKLKPSYLISTNGDNLYNFPAVDVVDRVVEYDKANNTTLLDNLIQTNVVGNIIVYNRAKPQFQYIKSTSGYLYVEYYVVAIIFVGSACIIYFVPFDKISHAIRKKFFAKNIH